MSHSLPQRVQCLQEQDVRRNSRKRLISWGTSEDVSTGPFSPCLPILSPAACAWHKAEGISGRSTVMWRTPKIPFLWEQQAGRCQTRTPFSRAPALPAPLHHGAFLGPFIGDKESEIRHGWGGEGNVDLQHRLVIKGSGEARCDVTR